MKTQWLTTSNLKEASQLIKAGRLVAFPTETVYGLGGDATNSTTCRAIYEAKGRASDNPFIVHVATIDEVEQVAYLDNEVACHLLKTFCPGPLTLVLPKKEGISRVATAGLNSVGVRIPSNPIARQFLHLCGVPVAAPSANRSGRPSPTTALMVKAELEGRIDAIINGGSSVVGLESTVVSCLNGDVTLLRAGFVTLEQLQQALPGINITVATHASGAVLSPGQKYAHYQPNCPLLLVHQHQWDLNNIKRCYPSQAIGVLSLNLDDIVAENEKIELFKFDNLEDYALQLYQRLVDLDNMGVQVIIACLPSNRGLGRALADRLLRAAAGRFIDD